MTNVNAVSLRPIGAEVLPDTWLRETVATLAANGWRCVPCRMHDDGSIGAARKYADGQTYPLSHSAWGHNTTLRDVFAVILDDAVLLDYDGNKAERRAVIGLEQLETQLGEPLGVPHQIRESNNSMHWLYRLPDVFSPDDYKNSQDGRFAPGVDIKRGNQPVYIKADKALPHGGVIPPRTDLPLVPAAILLQLEKPAQSARAANCDFAPSEKTGTQGALVLNAEIHRFQENAHEGGRNTALNTAAFTIYRLVAGGEIAEHDADAALEMAGEASGLDIPEVERVLHSAKTAAYKQPRQFENDVSHHFDANARISLPDMGCVEVGAGGSEGELLNPGYIDFPDKGARGKALSTARNLECVMNAYGITCRYNEVSKGVDIHVPGMHAVSDEYDTAAMSRIEDCAICAGITGAKIPQQVLAIAAGNPYNPFLDYINSAPWDGVSRIDALADTLTFTAGTDITFAKLLIRRWLISVVAAQVKNEFWSKGCLTFQGEQSKGKTSWLRRLFAGIPTVFKDGLVLDLRNKDSKMEALGFSCVELGELDATFKKSDIAALKAFIQQGKDTIRRPYGVSSSKWRRRTVFCASVNEPQFLADDTGNSRFWSIAVDNINFRHDVDMQQLWAEVLTLVENGERWHLSAEEEARLRESNIAFEVADPVEEKLRMAFGEYLPGQVIVRTLTASQVLDVYCGITNPNRGQTIKAAKVLHAMGFASRKTNGVKVFDLPAPYCLPDEPLDVSC